MNEFILRAGLLLLLAVAPLFSAPVPLQRAHAHNDYEHQRPLLDALDNGFCSVEADIYLVDGELLVAHDRRDLKSGRTLEKLYLDPLLKRTRENGGRVYPKGPTITLLIDFKSRAEETYAALREKLKPYQSMLTRFEHGKTVPGAVTVILSGNRPRALVAGEAVRYVGIDGRLGDLKQENSRHLLPLISDNWGNHFKWRGVGTFPAVEREKLERIIAKTHSRGQRIRFWATPDRVEVWRLLDEVGVDLLNTDDLKGMRDYLLSKRRPSSARE